MKAADISAGAMARLRRGASRRCPYDLPNTRDALSDRQRIRNQPVRDREGSSSPRRGDRFQDRSALRT